MIFLLNKYKLCQHLRIHVEMIIPEYNNIDYTCPMPDNIQSILPFLSPLCYEQLAQAQWSAGRALCWSTGSAVAPDPGV